MNIEPRAGVDFAEYAEAVGLPTSSVLSAVERGGAALVCFTREDGDDAPTFVQRFERDADEILRAVSVATMTPYTAVEMVKALFRAAGGDVS